MKPAVSLMVPLHSLGQDDQNEMQHDFFGHLRPLALHDASGIEMKLLHLLGQDG